MSRFSTGLLTQSKLSFMKQGGIAFHKGLSFSLPGISESEYGEKFFKKHGKFRLDKITEVVEEFIKCGTTKKVLRG
jgi:hypothetical protein